MQIHHWFESFELSNRSTFHFVWSQQRCDHLPHQPQNETVLHPIWHWASFLLCSTCWFNCFVRALASEHSPAVERFLVSLTHACLGFLKRTYGRSKRVFFPYYTYISFRNMIWLMVTKATLKFRNAQKSNIRIGLNKMNIGLTFGTICSPKTAF